MIIWLILYCNLFIHQNAILNSQIKELNIVEPYLVLKVEYCYKTVSFITNPLCNVFLKMTMDGRYLRICVFDKTPDIFPTSSARPILWTNAIAALAK